MMRQLLFAFFVWTMSASCVQAAATDDLHRNEVGFFDIHVCHWPDRAQFFMALFSTTRYDEVADIRLYSPTGKEVGAFKLDRYRLVKTPGKPEKHVFITLFDILPDREEGWYYARIKLKDGRVFEAKDKIELRSLPIAQNLQPVPRAEDVPLPLPSVHQGRLGGWTGDTVVQPVKRAAVGAATRPDQAGWPLSVASAFA
jgi:hypothetical protein